MESRRLSLDVRAEKEFVLFFILVACGMVVVGKKDKRRKKEGERETDTETETR